MFVQVVSNTAVRLCEVREGAVDALNCAFGAPALMFNKTALASVCHVTKGTYGIFLVFVVVVSHILPVWLSRLLLDGFS